MRKDKNRNTYKNHFIISVLLLLSFIVYYLFFNLNSSDNPLKQIVVENQLIQYKTETENISQAEYIFLAREKLAKDINVTQEEVFVEKVEPMDVDMDFECGQDIGKQNNGFGYNILLYFKGKNFNYRAVSNEVFACDLK